MTNAAETALRRIVAHLDGLGAGWALVGGFAVSARAEPRLTRDVDAAVAVADDDEAERVVHDLGVAGYRLETLVEQDAVGRLATVRMSDATGVLVDLLFASSGIEAEAVAGAERLEILPGLVVPVASAGHLAALKLLARDDETRPQDASDLRALRTVLSDGDRADLEQAIGLITARGYDRGRDLAALLADYLSRD